ncbi:MULTISPECIES: translation initiation factor IF-6 [Fervidicoccus]|jgi:translation initiation factor 6|nr:translation initiation factor IF-6 [Fervidicoccus fontis]PMB75780.1 MAG: translation initiation factor IF-6 [Fervidicoccus fontis]PMB76499.1 MAG: translation initiation factor IF-6 [Fervidicoccus fontis]HEW63456.1 translation initiation factor IF-6 [Fervidicoccus fontis]
MNFSKLSVFRNHNIGVYIFSNNKFALVPNGISHGSKKVVEETLGVDAIETTIMDTRIIGVLVSGNDRAILLPYAVKSEEIDRLKESIGGSVKIGIIDSKFTALGNYITANNKFAYISPLLEDEIARKISDLLDVKVSKKSYLGISIIGSIIVSNDYVAFVHPMLSDSDASEIKNDMKVEVVQTTVNEGVPFVKSGIVANNNGVLVGSATTGTEILNITSLLNQEI